MRINNTATLLDILLIVGLVLVIFSGVGMMGMMGFGFNPLGTILSLVFWALSIGDIALLVVWRAHNAGCTGLTAPSGDAALEILKTRYAKGEITKEQIDEIRKTWNEWGLPPAKCDRIGRWKNDGWVWFRWNDAWRAAHADRARG